MSAPPARAQVRLPALGEAESDELSIADERKLGDQIMREIWPDPAVVDDPVLLDYIHSLFDPLVAAARRRGDISAEVDQAFAWQPFLVRERTFNAFALPGGYIGVHMGLIAAAGSRDEMASVLGHELSHITQRHIARSMVTNKRQTLATLAGMLIGLVAASRSSNPDVTMAVLASGQAAMATGQLTFSREMEREADRFGLDVMASAGFAPSGMAAMFERLDAASRLNDSNQYPYLRSHPLTIERLSEARLRARTMAQPVATSSHVAEHALMRARARVLMDTSDPALRRLQMQARDGSPLKDDERLGALYAGALASVYLNDFAQAEGFLAAAQPLLAKFTTPPSGAMTSISDPTLERDFALLRLQAAIAKRAVAQIITATDALGTGRSRPVMLARAEAAVARSAARDNTAASALQRETEALQTWVAEHPRDALAWTLLAQCADPLGLKLRAIRAEAEAHAAQGDLVGAIDRLHAGQRLTRNGRADFVEASIIDSRLHELEAEKRALGKDLQGAGR